MRYLLVAVLFLTVSSRAQQDPSAAFYLDNCSGCHTIGGGVLAGPDLLGSTKWRREDLRAAVQRMESNTGPMTPSQIDGLVALLQDPNVAARLAAPRAPITVAKGSPEKGRRLFFGLDAFANGGTPCFGCHTVAGRGGSLSRDLTTSHARMGTSALLAISEQPAFPLMKGAYARHAVTAQEALDLAAFLEETAGATEPDAKPLPERTGLLHGTAGGVAFALFAGAGFIYRSRRRPPLRRRKP